MCILSDSPTVDFIRKIRLKENNNLTLINVSHIASAYLEITSWNMISVSIVYVKKVYSFNEVFQMKLFVCSILNRPLIYWTMSKKQF